MTRMTTKTKTKTRSGSGENLAKLKTAAIRNAHRKPFRSVEEMVMFDSGWSAGLAAIKGSQQTDLDQRDYSSNLILSTLYDLIEKSKLTIEQANRIRQALISQTLQEIQNAVPDLKKSNSDSEAS
jgi:hypothetical protein